MRKFPRPTVAETPPVSNRRQSLRQTRNNPTRAATTNTQARGSLSEPQDDGHQPNPGFFPAITHFTDTISALPKEMTRHYTMLKEVDAKLYGPEELLGVLVSEVRKAPVPSRKPSPAPQQPANPKEPIANTSSTLDQVDGGGPVQVQSHNASNVRNDSQEIPESPDLPRRRLIHDLKSVINEMLGTLDEKNHVMSTAIDELEKQLARCNSSYPHIENEISEEARHGSVNHWAYTSKAAEKKGTLAGERTRRDTGANHQTAGAGADHSFDGVASRSEARREALAARKNQKPHLDSDFDDGRTPAQNSGRKAQASSKTRRAADPVLAASGIGIGLGIANGSSSAPPPSKRRKIEKTNAGTALAALPMERAMSSVYGANAGPAKGAASSPRDTPTVETVKKRGRATGLANGTTRRRANTNASVADSPSMASSPVAGTFSIAKDPQRKSPAPALVQRAQPSRARQNSTQSIQDARNRPPSSTSNKTTNGNGIHSATADTEKASSLTSRIISDIKPTTKEAISAKGEPLVANNTIGGCETDLRVGMMVTGMVTGRVNDRSVKREETENGTGRSRADRPPSISISTRGSGKLSKTTTPLNATFSEPPPRSRPSRTTEPPVKRSHKKGAGLAAQLAAAAAAANRDEEGSSMQGDEEDDDDDESEPRYCYCNQVSYGEMVACDMQTCPREWFHLDCVGLTKAPKGNAKWFCDECKENLKRGKLPLPATGNGNGR